MSRLSHLIYSVCGVSALFVTYLGPSGGCPHTSISQLAPGSNKNGDLAPDPIPWLKSIKDADEVVYLIMIGDIAIPESGEAVAEAHLFSYARLLVLRSVWRSTLGTHFAVILPSSHGLPTVMPKTYQGDFFDQIHVPGGESLSFGEEAQDHLVSELDLATACQVPYADIACVEKAFELLKIRRGGRQSIVIITDTSFN